MLNEITIIIPTYNRTNFLKRAINYWDKSNLKYIICDSSSEINKEFQNYKNYIYKKNDNFFNKLYETVKIINTKYVLIVADDDILSIDSIKNCIDFLDKNKNFVSAQGAFMDFWYDQNNKIDICIRSPGISTKVSSLIDSDVNTRIIKSMKTYYHHIYAVHRRDVLKKALKISKKIKNTRASEINITRVGSTYGNHKMIEDLYSCRQVVPITNYKYSFVKSENFYEWLNNKSNYSKVNMWVNELTHTHSKINNISVIKTKEIIKKAIYSYGIKNTTFTDIIKNIILMFIPLKFINKFRHSLYYKKSWPPTSDQAKKIRYLSKNDKFYPWSNVNSKKKWHEIRNFLLEYGKVEDISHRL